MKVKANVILGKCRSVSQLYGMRVEETDGDWIRTWAFPIKEEYAVEEGFQNVKLHGTFYATEDYPGCPYCGGKRFYTCGNCGKINCWFENEKSGTCYWCGNKWSGEIRTVEKLDASGGGY